MSDRHGRLRFGIGGMFAITFVAAFLFAWMAGRISFNNPRSAVVADFAGQVGVFQWELSRPITSVFFRLDGKNHGGVSDMLPKQSTTVVTLLTEVAKDGSNSVRANLSGMKVNLDIPPLEHSSTTISHSATRRVTMQEETTVMHITKWLDGDGQVIRTFEVVASEPYVP